jgi:hypothetical protein
MQPKYHSAVRLAITVLVCRERGLSMQARSYLPDIIPAPSSREVSLLEEIILHRGLVNCDSGSKEP